MSAAYSYRVKNGNFDSKSWWDGGHLIEILKCSTKRRELKKKKKYKVAAAIGTSNNDINRAKYLLDLGVDLIVIDTAHGHSKKVLGMLGKVKKISSKLSVLEILLPQRQQKDL